MFILGVFLFCDRVTTRLCFYFVIEFCCRVNDTLTCVPGMLFSVPMGVYLDFDGLPY